MACEQRLQWYLSYSSCAFQNHHTISGDLIYMKNCDYEDKKVDPRIFLKKGFWIGLGAAGGLLALGTGAAIIALAILMTFEQSKSVGESILNAWDNMTLTKQQKQFKTCFDNQLIKNMKENFRSDWSLKENQKRNAYYSRGWCKSNGFKMFGIYANEHKIYCKENFVIDPSLRLEDC